MMKILCSIVVVLLLVGGTLARLGQDEEGEQNQRELLPICGCASPPCIAVCPTSPPCMTDVLIIGAGFAGLAAAKTIKDSNERDADTADDLNFLILESTDRVGGRVKSNDDAFPGVTIEECANWVFPEEDNPIWQLLQKKNYKYTLQDFYDYDVYEYNSSLLITDPDYSATQIPEGDVEGRRDKFEDGPYECLLEGALEYYEYAKNNGKTPNKTPKGRRLNYRSTKDYLKEECGSWEINDNQDFLNNWLFLEYEYAARSSEISISQVFDSGTQQYYMKDQRGFDYLADKFRDDNGLGPHIIYGQRVNKIQYNLTDPVYKAEVTTVDGSVYMARRVVLTVPAGTLNTLNGSAPLIDFVPDLEYSEADHNPMKVKNFIKVFYKFNTNFWGTDREFLASLQKDENTGWCHHWQNLDAQKSSKGAKGSKGTKGGDFSTSADFVPSSNILVCYLMDKAFDDLLVAEDVDVLTESMLKDKPLEPLRRVYGDVVDNKYNSSYYPQQNKNIDYGYGSYAVWAPGYTFQDHLKFYGGGKKAGKCDLSKAPHNGCSNNKWILHISGTCSCFEYWELVHGAYWAGERSAHFILHDLIGPVIENNIFRRRFNKSPCDYF